jgi:hypothetical protein
MYLYTHVNRAPIKIELMGTATMIKQADLDVEFCVSLVISSTPSPSKFKKNDDPTVVTLGDLDLINARFVGFYITGVRSGIRPYRLDVSFILSTRSTTVQDAAMSIYDNAVWP